MSVASVCNALDSFVRTCQQAALGKKRPSHPSAAEQLHSLRAERKEVMAKNGFLYCHWATDCKGWWKEKSHTCLLLPLESCQSFCWTAWWVSGGTCEAMMSTWMMLRIQWWSELKCKTSKNHFCCGALKPFISAFLNCTEFWGLQSKPQPRCFVCIIAY